MRGDLALENKKRRRINNKIKQRKMNMLLTCSLVALAQFMISPLATYLLISSTDVFLSGRPEGLLGDGKKASDKNTANLAF